MSELITIEGTNTMKNHVKALMLSLLVAGSVMAQSTARIGSHEAVQWNPNTGISSFSNASDVKEIAQQIIDVVGLKANFELVPANIPNAAAVTYAGKRYVLYNPNFIGQLERSSGTKWAGISVLAHEIGHHLNGHTISASGSQPQLELEADEFSGFVLRKMGATLSEAQAAMKVLASINASRTHPGKDDRLASIENGWAKADAQITGKAIAKTKPVTKQQPGISNTQGYPGRTASAQPVITDNNIIGKVRFNADPYSNYYVTSRYNLVKVKDNQLYVIGKLANTNSRNYPYLIYDEANTHLFVDVYGNILTRQGRSVGRLTAKA